MAAYVSNHAELVCIDAMHHNCAGIWQEVSSSWDEKMRIKAETKIFRENRAAVIEARKVKLQVRTLPECTHNETFSFQFLSRHLICSILL